MEENVRIEDLYDAYYECRRKKRNKKSAVEFEMNYESNIRKLFDELNARTYEISASVCFCVTRPKIREVFAASFRDRIVHHYLIRKIGHIIESEQIDDSYSCRKGKGVDFGVRRVAEKIKRISSNYTTECYVMKCDIKGFFMSIDKDIMWDMLKRVINEKYDAADKDFILWITEKIVKHRPEKNCEIHGNKNLFGLLSDDKTLFKNNGRGVPIGNLTSQIFGNFYLSRFDKEIYAMVDGGYGRYVDDIILIHPSKKYLLSLLPMIRSKLKEEYGLTLHPSKLYLQDATKGVKFVGQVIKPGRIYVGSRTVNNAFEMLERHCPEDVTELRTKANCYAGYMRGDKFAYAIRRRFLAEAWEKSNGKAYADRRWRKIVIKQKYNPSAIRRAKTINERNNNLSELYSIRAAWCTRGRVERRRKNLRKYGKNNHHKRLL